MRRRTWSVARLMAGIAILSVIFAALLALRPQRVNDDPGVGALTLLLATILVAGADRAVFGRKFRAFWAGFTATGCLCAIVAVTYLQEIRGYLLKHGPPLVRARQVFVRQKVAAREAELAGVDLPTPQVSEWSLLGSALTEAGLGFAPGLLAASAGGLLTASLASIAGKVGRCNGRASRRGHPD